MSELEDIFCETEYKKEKENIQHHQQHRIVEDKVWYDRFETNSPIKSFNCTNNKLQQTITENNNKSF